MIGRRAHRWVWFVAPAAVSLWALIQFFVVRLQGYLDWLILPSIALALAACFIAAAWARRVDFVGVNALLLAGITLAIFFASHVMIILAPGAFAFGWTDFWNTLGAVLLLVTSFIVAMFVGLMIGSVWQALLRWFTSRGS